MITRRGRRHNQWCQGVTLNSMGFSNSVSDLLESVSKANQDPYEVISSEDMLANTKKFNLKARMIMEEGREHLLRKITCRRGEGMKTIASCDKLWNKKSKETRRAAERERRMEK
jgi:hypothetical protein